MAKPKDELNKNTTPSVSESDTNSTIQPPEPPKGKQPKDTKQFIYVGPSVGRLNKNMVFIGMSYERLTEHYKKEIERCADVARLILPFKKLGATRAEILKGGNWLSECYSRVESACYTQNKKGKK
jgi:hypothetical protein